DHDSGTRQESVARMERSDTGPVSGTSDCLYPPLEGRGIACGFEGGIARASDMDSEGDSRLAEGVQCRESERYSRHCPTRARPMRCTICSTSSSSHWPRCCVGDSVRRIWRCLHPPKKSCCGSSFD